MEKYTQLREKHKTFIYHSYEITPNGFRFHFSMDDTDFMPEWSFSEKLTENCPDRSVLDYAVFCLGMTELVSYWKCACAPTVEVRCGALSQEQILWWKKLYFNGLGEFFYKNGIEPDFENFMTIVPSNSTPPEFTSSDASCEGFVIPVGGGKDSVVTLELLREYKDKSFCYIINPRPATVECAHIGGYGDERIISVSRTIDKELLKKNSEGYLNGHTPLSAIIAFSGWIFAYCNNRRYIALSNESSANEANINGTQINHQYSKSTEFERDFREFTKRYLVPSPEYFSMLRPWSEWQIAKKFVTYPQYFSTFQSCNVGSKTNTWCSDCAKCLYVYIMLAAFLDDKTLIEIFGKDMLNSEQYSALFNGLVYQDFDKPFECVGTKAEINLALCRAAEKRKGETLPLLLENYMDHNDSKPENLDDFFDDDNFVPDFLLELLRS